MNYTIFCMKKLKYSEKMKKHKTPGIDDITGEMIQAEGRRLQMSCMLSEIRGVPVGLFPLVPVFIIHIYRLVRYM